MDRRDRALRALRRGLAELTEDYVQGRDYSKKEWKKMPLKTREDKVVELYINTPKDEVDIAQELDMTTIEVIRILQANGVY